MKSPFESGLRDRRLDPNHTTETVAERYYLLENPRSRAVLEEHRKHHESIHGPTDPEYVYSSDLDADMQRIMFDMNPLAYFRELPPFVQTYIREQIEPARRQGELDALRDEYVKLVTTRGFFTNIR